jgi:hypothetical protein
VAAVGKGAEVGGRETSVGILVKIIPGEGEEGGKSGAVCDEECGGRVGVRFLVLALEREEAEGSEAGGARVVASARETLGWL